MSKHLVEFELEDGSTVVFETDHFEEAGPRGPRRIAADPDTDVQKSNKRFEAITRRIRPAAQLVLDALRELNTPKEIELEFGLKFGAQSGIIIASADSEVNFKVRIMWENSSGK